jgi:hypothetical protein
MERPSTAMKDMSEAFWKKPIKQTFQQPPFSEF